MSHVGCQRGGGPHFQSYPPNADASLALWCVNRMRLRGYETGKKTTRGLTRGLDSVPDKGCELLIGGDQTVRVRRGDVTFWM